MNGFIAEMIPEKCAESLVCAIITDAIYRYALSMVHRKDYETSESKKGKEIYRQAGYTIDEVETFFRGNWFANLAEYMKLNISGEQIIKMIRKSPKKFCNDHGRKKSYAN